MKGHGEFSLTNPDERFSWIQYIVCFKARDNFGDEYFFFSPQDRPMMALRIGETISNSS